QLEDERANVAAFGRGDDRTRKVVGHCPHVDGRHCDALILSARAGLVQRVDAGALDPNLPADFPDQPARRLAYVALSEDGGVNQPIDRLTTQRRRVLDSNATIDLNGLASALQQLLNGRERHRSIPSVSLVRPSITL